MTVPDSAALVYRLNRGLSFGEQWTHNGERLRLFVTPLPSQ